MTARPDWHRILPPATKTRAKKAWDDFIERLTPDAEEAARLAFTMPVLLRPDVLDFLVTEQNLAADQRGEVVATLLRYVQERIAEEPRVYVMGVGPIEALWEQIDTGERSLGQAMLAARALPVTETLTPAYVGQLLADLAAPGARPQTWRQARIRGQLVRAAAEACDRRDEPGFRSAYCRGVVHWAHGLLVSVPDGALLSEADRLGEEQLGIAQAAGDPPGIADAHYELASLWTDPYCSGRSSNDYATDDQAWRMRGQAELTRVDGRDPEDWEMPPADTALARAMTHWRAARDAQPDNAATLAGLAEADMWLGQVTGQLVSEDAAAAVRHGLELVADDPGELALKARFLMLASVLDVPAEPKSALVTADPDTLVKQFGDRVGSMVLQEIIGLSHRAPELALAVLDRQRELLLETDRIGDSDFKILCQTAARALHHATGAPGEVQPAPGSDFAEHAAQVLSRLGPDPEPGRQGATLLWLAYLSTGVDAEETGLALLRVLRQTAPLFARRNEWLVRAAEAHLLTGIGVNAYNQHDLPSALRAYLASLGAWLRQERLEPVKDMLGRLADIATGADEQVAIEIIGGIVSVAPVIATRLGGAADDHLFHVFSGVLGALAAGGQVNSEILWTILEFAKGLRTAMLLDRTTSVSVRGDAEAAGIIERIASRRPGAAAPLSLYQAFEKRRQHLLLDDLSVPALLDLDQARLALDHRTVLLSTATLIDRDRRTSRVAGIFWDEGQAFAGTLPLPPDLPPEEVPWIPGSAQDVLADRIGEGRDHLCIIPDSGLHVAPWHLYGWDDRLFADDWIVTMLPHPHLLFAGRGQLTVVGKDNIPVLAVGVTRSAASPDLPPLQDAREEALAIARRLGGRALLDSEATGQAVTRLAPSARYLHIASHGRFEPTAPSFHALLLQPQEGSDGVLCAWEVAELDLRAVHLVTLSACETARMVVESGENVDGLPIAFLAAGAKAVVGTQWEIETTASRHFFEELYDSLAKVGDIRDAFRAAQASTRHRFPDPRQWAAFYLLGDWR